MKAHDDTAAEQGPESQPASALAAVEAGPGLAGGGRGGAASSMLALQRAAGNRATQQLMRQWLPGKHNMPQPQTGPPARMPWEYAVNDVKRKLSVQLAQEGFAQQALTTLWLVYPPEDRRKAVLALDSGGWIDLLIDRLPTADVSGGAIATIVSERDPQKNKGLAKKLLQKGWFDWEVTDKDATAASMLIDVLPAADRKEMLESWFGEELRKNVPGSAEYEPAVGREILEGAILGDFDETPTWWSTLGQVVVGFIPYAGQVADARDTVAVYGKLKAAKFADGWLWAQFVLTLIGWVPGLGDIVKGVGRFGLKWLRKAGRATVGAFFGWLFKGAKAVLGGTLKKIMSEWMPKFRRWLKELLERYASKASKEAPTAPAAKPQATPPAKSSAPAKAAKEALEGLEKQADAAIDKFGKGKGGGKALDDVVEGVAKGAIEQLKAWVKRKFGAVTEMKYPYATINGDYLEIWGQGSSFRLVRVRIKEVREYTVEKTKKLIELTKQRTGLLKQAAKETEDASQKLYRAIKVTEELGERIADVLVRKEFPGARKLFVGKGSGVVDLVYEHAGKLVVVEAKGGTSRLAFREVAPGIKAQQGTLTYLDDIIRAMSRSSDSKVQKMAERLAEARKTKDGLLYVISKTGGIGGVDDVMNASLSFIRQ